MSNMNLKAKALFPLLVVGFVVAVAVAWQVMRFSSEQTALGALDKARGLIAQTRELRTYYTKNVVAAAKKSGLTVTYDYKDKSGAIPLPATMVHELNEALSSKEGYTVRLYSQYPFPFRKKGGPQDPFERSALDALNKNPAQEYWRQETVNGSQVIRYAIADRMVAQACVSCHNSHPLSPKRDWKLGDVRGALEVTIPVNRAQAAAAVGTRNALLIVGGGLAIMLLAAVLTVNRIVKPIKGMTQIAERLARGDVEHSIDYKSNDEIGRMADSFRSVIAYQKEMARTADALADGDLTASVNLGSKDDVLGHAFARMIASLRGLISKVVNNSASLATTSASLAASAAKSDAATDEITKMVHEVAEATDQTAHTSQEIARATEQQARIAADAIEATQALEKAIARVTESVNLQKEAYQKADAGIRETARNVETVAGSAKQMAAMAQHSSEIADKGGVAVEQTIASMKRIQEHVEASSQRVETLGRKGQEIGAIVETIDQIAEQTNLLALNAAIEAARAGENGRGFAVVADEVRKLAERSALATREIADLIESIKAEVSNAVDAMATTGKEVAEGATRSNDANDALIQIRNSVQSVASEVQNVSGVVEAMTSSMHDVLMSEESVRDAASESETAVNLIVSSVEQVSSAISGVAAVCEQTAAGAEEMSATSQQVSANTKTVSRAVQDQRDGVEQVSHAVNDLKFMADHLAEQVQHFRLDTGDDLDSSPLDSHSEQRRRAA